METYNNKRRIEEVDAEIAVFKKYGTEIPQELIDERSVIEMENLIKSESIEQQILNKVAHLFNDIDRPLAFNLVFVENYGWDINVDEISEAEKSLL